MDDLNALRKRMEAQNERLEHYLQMYKGIRRVQYIILPMLAAIMIMQIINLLS